MRVSHPNRNIDSIAEKINKMYKDDYQNDEKVALDIRGMVSVLGGSIRQVPFLDMGVDSMNIEESEKSPNGDEWEYVKFTIYVSMTDSRRRQNFTIAHELGHLYLHFLKWKDESTRKTTFKRLSYAVGGDMEREANMFAGALLMPKSEYERIYREYGGDLIKIADIFDVSVSAAEVRARVLQLDKEI